MGGASLQKSSKEPTFICSEDDVAKKSPLAKSFIEERTKLNRSVDAADNQLVKRFYNIDHNCYLEGELPAKFKELLGLTASLSLRCNECIFYHVIQAYRLGCTREEIHEALNVALVVGGSITIPHMRKAYALMAELFEAN